MKPLDRRSFLARGAVLTGAAGAALATGARAADLPDTPSSAPTTPGGAVAGTDLSAVLPFTGVRQSGILNPAPAHATLVAFDSMAPDARTLGQALQVLSTRARELSAGGPVPLLEADAPPADSGTLGPDNAPDALTVTISFGASLFDGRYGLAPQRPRELIQMPTFPVDELDPAKISHGDVLVQICAQHRDTVVHTVRELVRTVRGSLAAALDHGRLLRAPTARPSRKNSPRNLFAFRDGTGNPATTDAEADGRARVGRGGRAGLGRRRHLPGGAHRSGCTSSSGIASGSHEQEQHDRPRRATAARRWAAPSEYEDPRYDLDPEGRTHPAGRPHPPGQPAHRGDRPPADPPPRLQLPPGLRRGGSARPGPAVRGLQPQPEPSVRCLSRTASTASR